MAEVAEEATHVWSAKQRIALFLSAMRHFAGELQARHVPLQYVRLDDTITQTLRFGYAHHIQRLMVSG